MFSLNFQTGASAFNLCPVTRILQPIFAISLLVSCQIREHRDYAKLIPVSRGLPSSAFHKSIHHSEFTVDPLVTNGDCYEQFQIEVPDSISIVTLPSGTTTHRGDGTLLVGHLKKSLHWAGHPGDTKVSIDDERLQMGVAMKTSGRAMYITSFGAWDSFEGGSSTSILVSLPNSVSVRYAKNLPESLTADKLAQQGWIVIPSVPALKQDYDRFSKP
jgi:hypothetical protein